MGIKSFLYSDTETKKKKLYKWLHRNDWEKNYRPSFISRIKNEWYYIKNSQSILVVDGWLLKFNDSKEKYMNWGDDLNVYLIELLSRKRVVPLETLLFREFHKRYLIIGSILPNRLHRKAVVWGSGVMDSNSRIKHNAKSIQIKAVRGPLTRRYLLENKVECPEVYGDPALLLPMCYTPKTMQKKYKLSIIPHHRDFDEGVGFVNNWSSQLSDAHIINKSNYSNWTDVIDDICQSEVVLRSSLHGLIVSDAYGVPNRFVEFNYHHPNYDKYNDYYESICKEFTPPY